MRYVLPISSKIFIQQVLIGKIKKNFFQFLEIFFMDYVRDHRVIT